MEKFYGINEDFEFVEIGVFEDMPSAMGADDTLLWYSSVEGLNDLKEQIETKQLLQKSKDTIFVLNVNGDLIDYPKSLKKSKPNFFDDLSFVVVASYETGINLLKEIQQAS